jgi:hypothetical protein
MSTLDGPVELVRLGGLPSHRPNQEDSDEEGRGAVSGRRPRLTLSAATRRGWGGYISATLATQHPRPRWEERSRRRASNLTSGGRPGSGLASTALTGLGIGKGYAAGIFGIR